MGSSGSDVRIRKLTRGGKYHEWAAQIRAQLVELDLDEFLDDDHDPSDDAAKKKDRRCKARLLLAVEGALIRVVEDSDTAKEAWEALKADHLGGLRTRRPMLLAELRGLKQRPQESVVDYGERAYELLRRLEDLELGSAETLLSDAFLQGLRPSLQNPIVPVVTQKVDLGFEAVLDEVKAISRLVNDAVRKPPSDEGIMLGAEGQKSDRSKPGRKETRRCHHCGKTGHLKRDCWQLQAVPKGEGQRQGAVLVAQAPRVQRHVAAARIARSTRSAEHDSGLLLDSGATHHIVNSVESLYDCKQSEIVSVAVGNGQSLLDLTG
jgi:hypothetical protein